MRRLRNVPADLFVQFCLSALRTFVFIDPLESTSNEALQMELVRTSISRSTTLTFTQTTGTAHYALTDKPGLCSDGGQRSPCLRQHFSTFIISQSEGRMGASSRRRPEEEARKENTGGAAAGPHQTRTVIPRQTPGASSRFQMTLRRSPSFQNM